MDWVDGGRGDDVLFGRRNNGYQGEEVVSGGPGDDRVAGGPGDDLVGGHQGADWVSGGAGDDFVEEFQDGMRDYIDCGPGFDRYYTPDRFDHVSNCERKIRPITTL